MSSATKPEYIVKTGKNGEKALRTNDGMTLLFPTWNTPSGEVVSNGDIVERIALCLRFCQGYSSEYLSDLGSIQTLIEAHNQQLWYDQQKIILNAAPVFVYDYDKYGYMRFQTVDGKEPLTEQKTTLREAAENRWPLRVIVIRDRS